MFNSPLFVSNLSSKTADWFQATHLRDESSESSLYQNALVKPERSENRFSMVKCQLVTLYQATQSRFWGAGGKWGSWCEDEWDTIKIISQSNIF